MAPDEETREGRSAGGLLEGQVRLGEGVWAAIARNGSTLHREPSDSRTIDARGE